MKKVNAKKIEKLEAEETKRIRAGIQDIDVLDGSCPVYCYVCSPESCPKKYLEMSVR